MVAKARLLSADEVVLDLEDAVSPARKDAARSEALDAIAIGGFTSRAVAVRINAPRTPWAHQDLIAIGSGERRPETVVVPKVESAGDLAFVERLLDGVEGAAGHVVPLRIQALIETARGMRSLDEIVRSSARLEAVILGYADLGASLGRSRAGAARLDLWLAVQDAVLAAARAAEIQAIDGPFLAIGDANGLRAACERAAQLGFDGKWVIHPSQLPTVTAAFTPDAAAVEHAKSVLAALEVARDHERGAAALDGQMLDEAVRLSAQRTLARAGETT
jgi:citrate lyase subunit beta/citryl-CoA lyase